MTVQNNLRPTTFPPVARDKPSIPSPSVTGAPETPPVEAPTPVAPGGMVGNHVNTTA